MKFAAPVRCVLISALLILFSVHAMAGVQMTEFGVDSPPPPESETPPPAPGSVHGATAQSASTIPTHDPTVGTLLGYAGVNGGAATYHVPIVVPPGRAGMEPTMSLDYSSRSGNGVLGVGWTLSGLSSIHRCPRTAEQDKQTLGVSYTNNDRLCLDGQRLIPVNGNYGVVNTEYRTEVDSHARIIQVGGDLTGTATCFRVEQADGRILHYGAVVTGTTTLSCASSTANSRVNPNRSTSTTLSWLVEKMEDRVGNNQFYAYTSSTYGENLISSITYTGLSSTAGNRTVSFSYVPRTNTSGVLDTTSTYLAGGLTMQTQELASITTAVGGTTIRTITPGYSASAYSGRLLLQTLTECGGTTCHPPTSFLYNDGPVNASGNFVLTNLSSLLPAAAATQNMPYQLTTIADLDGDGTKESALTVIESDGLTHQLLLEMTGDRTASTPVDLSSTPFSNSPAMYADVDGSGRSALIVAPTSTSGPQVLSFGVWNYSLFARGTPATSNPLTVVASNIPFSGSNLNGGSTSAAGAIFAADVDGDGNIDIVTTGPSTTCGSDVFGTKNGVFVWINTTTGALPVATPSFKPSQGTIAAPQPQFCLTRTQVGSSPPEFVEEHIDHIADFDGNGLPDFYLTTVDSYLGHISFSRILETQMSGTVMTNTQVTPLNCDGTQPDDECSWYNGYVTHWMDVNGDGLEDFVIARTGNPQWQVRLNQGNGTLGAAITPTVANGTYVGLDAYAVLNTAGAFRYASNLPIMDVDGDGKPDILIPQAGAAGFAVKMCTMSKVNQLPNMECPGGGTEKQCPAYSCPEDPGSPTANMPPESGVNGYPYTWNGQAAYGAYTPDLSFTNSGKSIGVDNSTYHLSMLKFVQTGPNAMMLVSVPTTLISRLSSFLGQHTDDVFGDGLPDLITPVGCADYIVQQTDGSPMWKYPLCSAVNDGTHGPTYMPDGTTPTASFAQSPTLFVNVNQGVATQTTVPAFKGGPSPLSAPQPVAKSGAINFGLSLPNLPGLLDKSINGVSDGAQWVYVTLSVVGIPGISPFYAIPSGNGYSDNRHYFFQSSMPAVEALAQYTGTGDNFGFRSAIYGYAQAIYNHYGRGFEGFNQIISETAARDADAARRVLTTTTYNQEFPLVGKVTQITQVNAVTGAMFAEEFDSYQCATTSDGSTFTAFATCPQGSSLSPIPTGSVAFQPVLTAKSTYRFDPATGTQASHANLANTWDNYGNVTNQTTIQYDDSSASKYKYLTSQTTQTTNQFDTTSSVLASWWLNKLNSTSVQASIAYAAGHPFPGGSDPSSQTLATAYTWNTDRTPQTKTVQATLFDQQSVTLYCYPQSTATLTPSCPATSPSVSYGLPLLTKLCLGYYDSNGVCNGDVPSTLSPERITQFSYTSDGTTASADGYFVLGTTDDLGYVTQTSHDTGTGQVLTTTDPNSVKTVNSYDVFGRLTEVDHVGKTGGVVDSPVIIAYNSCLDKTSFPAKPGNCNATYIGEDTAESTYEANAAYRVTTSQSGYPTRVRWVDLLGRSVREGHVGFEGSFRATLTNYDKLGTVALQSTPYFAGTTDTTPFLTTWTYDILNRPLVKVVDDSELTGSTKLETDYLYSGRTTTITVHDTGITLTSGNACPSNSGNLCLQMDRSVNALGQVMQTNDYPILGTGSATTTLTTNFWTEPFGHVAAISDAETNITQATYNPLGQRTQSVDPDQGTWKFTYDALGELITQTDYRGVKTTVNVRDGLGRLRERQEVPPSTPITGLQFETELDDWTYDPSFGVHELGSVVRRRANGSTVPPMTATPVWQEAYTYESATARLSTTTTTVNETSSFPMGESLTYDSTNGRLSSRTYPSGLVVSYGYTANGQLSSLSNSTTGYTYWTATAENEWDHVTGESFAGGITGSHADYHSTGQPSSLTWSSTDAMTYGYDSFQNLTSQARSINHSNTEYYTYDPLQRLTKATRSGGVVDYGYTASGNLAFKDDFSTNSSSAYTYASANSVTNNCGPHAVNTVALPGSQLATYTCDANGNVIGGNTLAASYDAENHPRTISRTFLDGGVPYEPCATGHPDTIFCDGFDVLPKTSGSGSAVWAYDSNGQRDYESSAQQAVHYYAPAGYEYVSGISGGNVGKHELGPVIVTRNGTTDTVTVTLRDRLGSTLDTIDSEVLAQRAYDSFGAARNGDMSMRPHGTLNLTPDTIHGFTAHTHEDDVGLLHMNGRIYDYAIGRFLSVDPIVGNSLSSQAMNPYSYLGNNPLAGRDPTGYEGCTTGTNFSGGNGESCENLGVGVTQIGGPSVTEKNDAIAHYFGVAYGSPSTYANVSSNGAVGMSSQGAGGVKNAQAPASDQMALDNAPNTKPSEQPATEPQDQRNTTALGTINVTGSTTPVPRAPSHDFEFYLSQKYSPNRPYYHKYGGPGSGDWAVCHPSSNAWCTDERGYDALTRFVYPGQDPSQPVQNGDINMIYWPDGEAVGHIQTLLEPATFSVYNLTRPDHVFYDGYVRRQVVTEGDTLFLRTTGEGNDANEYRLLENMATWRPGFNQSNESFRVYMIQSWLKEQP